MSTLLDRFFDDETFNEKYHPDLNVRLAIFKLHEEHWDFLKRVSDAIEVMNVSEEQESRMKQWLILMADNHYDYMLRNPDDFLEIYEDFVEDI